MTMSRMSVARRCLQVLLIVAVIFNTGVSGNLNLEVSQDARRVIDLGTFAFGPRGYFRLEVKEFMIFPDAMEKDPNFHSQGPIGFVLDPVVSAQGARIEKNNANTEGVSRHVCFIEDVDIAPKDPSRRHIFPMKTNATKLEQVFSVDVTKPALYALFFYNCKGFHSNGTSLTSVPVSFSAKAVLYNVDSSGKPNFLSYGTTSLPYWYMFFSLGFAALSYLWAREMKRNASYVHKVHQIMLLVVVLKGFSLFFETLMLGHYAATGHGSVWDVLYYIVLGFKGILLFSVLLLLGSGWSVVKAFLSESDRKIMMIIVPCQIFIDIALAVINESNEGRKGWAIWVMVLNLVDLLCCCCVLLPIVWSIKNLHSAAASDEKVLQTIARLKQFRSFYIIVVSYIYFTRILIVMIEGFTPFDSIWFPRVLRELAALIFYAYTGMRFLPAKDSIYSNLAQEDIDEVEMRNEVAAGEA